MKYHLQVLYRETTRFFVAGQIADRCNKRSRVIKFGKPILFVRFERKDEFVEVNNDLMSVVFV